MPTAFLPQVSFPPPNAKTGGVAPREVLTAAAQAAQPARQQMISLAPAGTPARVVLGRRPVGGDIDNALVHGAYWVMRVIWCWAPGGIDAVESVTWNDEALPAGVTITTYTGAAGQGIDPTLEAAWLAAGTTYTDTLPDVSYSVIKCPHALVSNGGLPNLVAMVRGVKAYDPRENLLTYSEQINNAAWSNSGGVTADAAVAPDGATTADLPTDGNYHQQATVTVTAGATYTASCFAKTGPSGANQFQIRYQTGAASERIQATFNTDTGAIVSTQAVGATLAAYGAEQANGGYWRFWVRGSLNTATTAGVYLQCTNPTGLYMWGAQLNRGDLLDYTATTSAAITPHTAHTSNPALLTATWLTATEWGPGLTVDNAQLCAAANANDALVGGQPRRTMNLILTGPAPFERRVEELRSYAGCFVEHGPDGVLLIPDRPVASSGTLSHAAGQIRRFGKISKRPQSAKPTLIRVRWTDPSTTPWNTAAIAEFPPGGSAERISEVPMPGITDYSEALRFATERYNRLTLSDLSFPLDTFADATGYRVGDVIDVTLPGGITAKPMQVFSYSMPEAGLGSLALAEYDPLIFSDTVAAGPSYADTSLASPNDPQPPTGLTLTEEVFAQAGDAYASRIKVTWTAPASYPWVKNYRINVITGSTVIWSGTAEAGEPLYRSGALTEGLTYQVDVYTASPTGSLSTPASDTLLAQASGLTPGDVPSFSGFEAGGEVRLRWGAATDIDIRRYEVRYVSVGGLWSAGTVLDRVDGLRLVTQAVPAGTWDFHVRALDSRGNYSANSAVWQITVDFDDGAFLLDDATLTTVALVNAVELTDPRGGATKRYVSTDGMAWNTKFSAAFNTYTNPILSYFNSAASSVTLPSGGVGHDFGLSLSGNWVGEIDAATLAGTVTTSLGLDNGGGFTDYSSMIAKTTARYARVKAEAASGSALMVTVPTALVRLSAIGRQYKGTGTSVASGPTTITLTSQVGEIAAFNGPAVITPGGTTAASYTVDNYVTGATPSFDVYIFDAAGNQIARDFGYGGEVV